MPDMTIHNLLKGIAVLAICLCSSSLPAATQAFKYQGFNLMAFGKADYADEDLVRKSLDYIVSVGSNFVNIDWMVAVDDNGVVLPPTSPASFEPPRSDIGRIVELAHQRGLKVFLKPHVGFPNTPFDNRATFNTDMSRFSLGVFFPDWTTYLTSLGSWAATMGVAGLVIGTENAGFDSANRPQWLSLIAAVREIFPGKIAYDAAFAVQSSFRVTDVCFWDAVDIIGVSLYVALSRNDQASPQELNDAWRSNPFGVGDIIDFLHAISTRYNKPVMALEGGYQSAVGGLYDVGPIEIGRPVDNSVQARGFAAYLDTLGKYQGNWFWGVSIWTAYPPFFDPARQVLLGYTQGYMTNGKPATEVIRNYFTGAAAYSDPVFAGTIAADRVFGSYANDTITGNAGDDFLWGGAGDDLIVAGPVALAPASTASVVVLATGDVRASGGPRLRLLINGQAVDSWTEVTSPRGSRPQEIVFSVPLASYSRIDSFRIESLPDPEFGNGVNRAIYISGIRVNDIPLLESDGTYTAGNSTTVGAGSWGTMWSGTALTQDVVPYQSLFFGATTDNDVIIGGPGNDTIDGGTGVDAAIYSGRHADYTITRTAGGYEVRDNVGDDGIDTLVNVELLQFADRLVDLRLGQRLMPVVEYYNASLDHYFITWLPLERAALDLESTPTRWTATGFSLYAYADAQAGSSPVCRYYLPPRFGDSHFFGRGTSECTATGQANPGFVLEDPQFMHMHLPSGGVCPTGTAAIYRVFSNRADANHRYATDQAVRDSMVARGWLAEGDGPQRVVMCAPQ